MPQGCTCKKVLELAFKKKFPELALSFSYWVMLINLSRRFMFSQVFSPLSVLLLILVLSWVSIQLMSAWFLYLVSADICIWGCSSGVWSEFSSRTEGQDHWASRRASFWNLLKSNKGSSLVHRCIVSCDKCLIFSYSNKKGTMLKHTIVFQLFTGWKLGLLKW